MPSNYQSRGGVTVNVGPNMKECGAGGDRRAGPLFMHLHTFPKTGPAALLLAMESAFIGPEVGSGLSIATTRNKSPVENWTIADNGEEWRQNYELLRDFINNRPPIWRQPKP